MPCSDVAVFKLFGCGWNIFMGEFWKRTRPAHAWLSLISPDCYVADELVVSRAGRRVRVGNTDAEGRMVMVDLLCEMKEKVRMHLPPFLSRSCLAGCPCYWFLFFQSLCKLEGAVEKRIECFSSGRCA